MASRNYTALTPVFGIRTFFRRFGPSFARILSSLNYKLQNNQPSVVQLWTKREKASCDEELPTKIESSAGIAAIIRRGANDTR